MRKMKMNREEKEYAIDLVFSMIDLTQNLCRIKDHKKFQVYLKQQKQDQEGKKEKEMDGSNREGKDSSKTSTTPIKSIYLYTTLSLCSCCNVGKMKLPTTPAMYQYMLMRYSKHRYFPGKHFLQHTGLSLQSITHLLLPLLSCSITCFPALAAQRVSTGLH